MNRSRTAVMVEGALCVALAIVLSKFDLFKMPNGGSIDLGLAPLLVFAWRRGLRWGCGAGALTGVVKVLFGGHIFHPAQAVLDYPLAYACAGLAAIFPHKRAPGRIAGILTACIGQTFCHILSGAIFFAQYAPEGQSPWVYSTIYNVALMTPKYIVSGIAAWVLIQALDRVLPAQPDAGR